MKYAKYMFFDNNKKSEILFAPQTAGPFLATVPKRKIDSLMKKAQDLNKEGKTVLIDVHSNMEAKKSYYS